MFLSSGTTIKGNSGTAINCETVFICGNFAHTLFNLNTKSFSRFGQVGWAYNSIVIAYYVIALDWPLEFLNFWAGGMQSTFDSKIVHKRAWARQLHKTVLAKL